MNERLARLEARRASGATPAELREPPPAVTLHMKVMDRARSELDGLEPEPLDLTPEEERAALEGSAWFVETGAALLRDTTTDPDHQEAIARMEELAREDIEQPRGANE